MSLYHAIDIENFIGQNLMVRHIDGFSPSNYADKFLRAGFSRHFEIIKQKKPLNGRLFYIMQYVKEFWAAEMLKSNLLSDIYSKKVALPSSFFMPPLLNKEQIRLSGRSLQGCEYLLDKAENENDMGERVIAANIHLSGYSVFWG